MVSLLKWGSDLVNREVWHDDPGILPKIYTDTILKSVHASATGCSGQDRGVMRLVSRLLNGEVMFMQQNLKGEGF
jgi:hypothetical protein